MDNTVVNNRLIWDQTHDWSQDGDEWQGQAVRCGKPYEAWKASLAETLLLPNLTPAATVLEIGPGHGRWTRFMAGRVGRLVLVDISQNCLDFCRRALAPMAVETHLSSGATLPPDLTGAVDFIWSYDAFVHVDRREAGLYLKEMARVLVPGGRAVIHHPNRRHATLWLGFLRRLGKRGAALYRRISMGPPRDDDGWRANVSGQLFAGLAAAAGLKVESQLAWWRDGFGVPRYNDRITILSKPDLSKPDLSKPA